MELGTRGPLGACGVSKPAFRLQISGFSDANRVLTPHTARLRLNHASYTASGTRLEPVEIRSARLEAGVELVGKREGERVLR